MLTTEPETKTAEPAAAPPTTLDDLADDLADLADQVALMRGSVAKIAEYRPSPWPWIAVSVMWAALVLLAAVLVRYLPDAAWSDGHGWIIFLAVLVAGVCTYKMITRED